MRLEDLRPNVGANKPRRRLGRGPGSGWGKTAARGGKGQTARSGGGIPAGFEGGQTPLYRRIPKRGFVNVLAIPVISINLKDLTKYVKNGIVDGKEICGGKGEFKVLSSGDVPSGLKIIRNTKFSKAAEAKLQEKGVSIER